MFLHVAETTKGGIQTYLKSILPHHRSRSDSFGLLIPNHELPNYASFSASGFNSSSRGLRSCINMGFEIINLSSRECTLILHSTIAGFVGRLLIATRIISVAKVIYIPHGWAFDRRSSKLTNYVFKISERMLSKYCNSIVCISNHDYESALQAGLDEKKLIPIPNSVDIPVSYYEMRQIKNRYPIKVLFVGRFDRQKGFEVFQRIAGALAEDSRFSFTAIGDSVLDDDGDIPKVSGIHYLGWLERERVLQYMSSHDLLVVPSLWEGFGLVALESIGVGTPVLASDAGGLPEIINSEVGAVFSAESVSFPVKWTVQK